MTTDVLDDNGELLLPLAGDEGGRLCFETPDGADQALRLGAFCVAVPEDLDVEPGLRLCRNFYKPSPESTEDRYRGHRDDGHSASKLGYEDRPDQVEQLQLEKHLWERYLPDEVTSVLTRLRELTLHALEGMFDAAGIPEADREVVTGGARSGSGLCYTTVNHYRSELTDRCGIVEHSDSGFITTICTDQPGYEILHDGCWRPVKERPGYLVVNLGDAFRVLTLRLPRPVTAVYHRVPELHPHASSGDRSSFTIYMGPRYDMMLYQYDPDGVLHEYQGFREFSVEKSKKLNYEFHSRI